MPGIDTRAPERTERSSGLSWLPNSSPVCFSMWAIAALTSGSVKPFSL